MSPESLAPSAGAGGDARIRALRAACAGPCRDPDQSLSGNRWPIVLMKARLSALSPRRSHRLARASDSRLRCRPDAGRGMFFPHRVLTPAPGMRLDASDIGAVTVALRGRASAAEPPARSPAGHFWRAFARCARTRGSGGRAFDRGGRYGGLGCRSGAKGPCDVPGRAAHPATDHGGVDIALLQQLGRRQFLADGFERHGRSALCRIVFLLSPSQVSPRPALQPGTRSGTLRRPRSTLKGQDGNGLAPCFHSRCPLRQEASAGYFSDPPAPPAACPPPCPSSGESPGAAPPVPRPRLMPPDHRRRTRSSSSHRPISRDGETPGLAPCWPSWRPAPKGGQRPDP